MSSSTRTDQPTGRRYRLVGGAAPVSIPVLDEQQQRVVDHPGGPLLVLAGPGTGKTTTLVEAIAELIEGRGVDPEQILALTFSRKAAEQLRDRITARVGRTMATTMSSTFHSFAYGLIKRFAPEDLYDAPLRLLSAPEQDVVLRELLRDHPESVRWPASLRQALGTRGFAHEVGLVLSRARERGLDGSALSRIGREEGLPAWETAGIFLDHYLTILDAQGATDYPDLIRRALIEAEDNREVLRSEITHVFVDEYQDTDPSQVALLQTLSGAGRNLVVVGDPHQSIYGFRGADVRGILDFPGQFRTGSGDKAPVVALRHTRRFGRNVLVASQRVAGRLTLTGSIPESARAAFAAPESLSSDRGKVEVLTFDSDRAEAEHLADLLRRAHLEDGLAWSDMAVLVRSGRASIGPLRRSLTAAGVPVEVAGDEVPLVADPAVLPMLEALRLSVAVQDPTTRSQITAEQVTELLTGPLGGLDAAALRRLARQLRVRDKEPSGPEAQPPRPSRELTTAVLAEPGFLEGLSGPEAETARAAVMLIESTAQLLALGGSAHEALWELWTRANWQARLRRSIDVGGAAARRAHRDLDALCALFERASRAQGQLANQSVQGFIEALLAQEIPSDTLAERGLRGDAVRLLTAHRSKGLEWDLVVVAHVQEGAWPDLRRRSTLLGADRIGTDAALPPVSARTLLKEERRLFYVACTRAKRRLVVTAVESREDDGETPSRFLDELGVTIRRVQGRPARPLSLDGVVAQLRRTLCSPEAPPALRAAAARRLAALARERVGVDNATGLPDSSRPSRALVPGADPSNWWGLRERSLADDPMVALDRPVPLSPSALEGLATCPAQWFLSQRAGGVAPTHQAANVGMLVHALAERVTTGEVPGELDTLRGYVDEIWPRLEFRTPWARSREYDRTMRALERFLTWNAETRRRVIATEVGFRQAVGLPDGERVTLTGRADRVEIDEDGNLVVVDLKTGKDAPSGPQVEQHAQLSLYQYALSLGALDELAVEAGAAPGETGDTSAELVHLGLKGDAPIATVQRQETHHEQHPVRRQLLDSLARAAALMRSEEFPAIPGAACRTCRFQGICPTTTSGAVIA